MPAVYVGLNNKHLLPSDYFLSYEYSFFLLHKNDSVIDINEGDEIGMKLLGYGTDDALITTDRYNEIEQYSDIGRAGVYSRHDMLFYRDDIVDANQCFTIRCRLRGFPKHDVVPFGYDCKTHTGMVGLQNLGATCYLNSLLQV